MYVHVHVCRCTAVLYKWMKSTKLMGKNTILTIHTIPGMHHTCTCTVCAQQYKINYIHKSNWDN